MAGRFEFICGPMFAGKTTEMYRRVNRESYRPGRNCIIVKYIKDTRFATSGLQMHSGDIRTNFITQVVNSLNEVNVDNVDVIGVDELQFYENIDAVFRWADQGKIVICAGLDADANRKAFPSLVDTVAGADNVTKLLAVCACGDEAPFTQLYSGKLDDHSVKIGGAECYRAVCRRCYIESLTGKSRQRSVISLASSMDIIMSQ